MKKKKYLNNPSKVIIKYQYLFKKTTILFGNTQKLLPYFLKNKFLIIFTRKYNFLKYVNLSFKKKIIYYGLYKSIFKLFDFFVFFWSKDKQESINELKKGISFIKKKKTIIIVGENKSGIITVKKKFKNIIKFIKIIKIKHCILIIGKIKKKIKKKIKFLKYKRNKKFYSIPGLFSYKKFDKGSLFLISILNRIKGNVLDLGCGNGIIGISLLKKFPKIHVTFTDICLNALLITKKNIIKKKIKKNKYEIITSNIFKNIKKKYNYIICNPPIHNNLKININFIKNMFKKFNFFLKKKGKIIIVLNNFISIKYIKEKIKIFKKEKNFSIYIIKKKNTQSGT